MAGNASISNYTSELLCYGMEKCMYNFVVYFYCVSLGLLGSVCLHMRARVRVYSCVCGCVCACVCAPSHEIFLSSEPMRRGRYMLSRGILESSPTLSVVW